MISMSQLTQNAGHNIFIANLNSGVDVIESAAFIGGVTVKPHQKDADPS